jgi:hypothetical protein
MAAWIGLAGVVVGALMALTGQYLIGRTERNERSTGLLVEQYAVVVALSEDFRNQVWEERTGAATSVVGGWDYRTYRPAAARLRVLSQDREFLAALHALTKSGTALGKAWRLSSDNDTDVESAWQANRDAIDQFVSVSSQIVRRRDRQQAGGPASGWPDRCMGRMVGLDVVAAR